MAEKDKTDSKKSEEKDSVTALELLEEDDEFEVSLSYPSSYYEC